MILNTKISLHKSYIVYVFILVDQQSHFREI